MILQDASRFDWVTAKVECNAYNLFAELREIVHSDCDAAMELAEKKPVLHGVVFQNDNPNVFIAMRKGDSRIFRISQDLITVANRKGEKLFSATPIQRGKVCYLQIDGTLLLPWQFSQRVLEDFFFNEPKSSE